MLSQHLEQVVLPFFVHQFIGNEGHGFSGSLLGQSAGRDEDVQMRVELSRAAVGLQHHHATDVQGLTGGGLENVLQTGVAGRIGG